MTNSRSEVACIARPIDVRTRDNETYPYRSIIFDKPERTGSVTRYIGERQPVTIGRERVGQRIGRLAAAEMTHRGPHYPSCRSANRLTSSIAQPVATAEGALRGLRWAGGRSL